MKKVLIILLFMVSLGFSQRQFEIESVVTFDLDTVTWIRLANDVNVSLQTNTAYWQVEGLKVTTVETDSVSGDTILFHFRTLLTKTVQVNYTGQAITRTAQKNATAARFDLVYTGEEQ